LWKIRKIEYFSQICVKRAFTGAINDWIHIIFVPKCPVSATKPNGNTGTIFQLNYKICWYIESAVFRVKTATVTQVFSMG